MYASSVGLSICGCAFYQWGLEVLIQSNVCFNVDVNSQRAKEKILCAIECKANNSSNMSQLLQKIIDLQAKNTEMSYQDIINVQVELYFIPHPSQIETIYRLYGINIYSLYHSPILTESVYSDEGERPGCGSNRGGI